MNAPQIQGGRGVVTRAGGVALLALAATGAGIALDPQRALWAYHAAFTYWAGIAVAALILLGSFHATKARWPVVLRRVLEAIPRTLILFLVLFAPVALGMNKIFAWVDPQGSGLTGELLHLAHHRHAYLNVPFFLVRQLLYFGTWIVVGGLLWRWSVRQDAEKGVGLTVSQRRLGTGALPLLAITLTFAAVDWQESLDLHHNSTIFGVYYFAGSFLSAVAVLVLALYALRREEPFRMLSADHWHALGKLLLAFTAFWAYIAFSQYMLIWIANLPEEAPYFIHRTKGPWGAVGAALFLLHFVVPFFALLSRDLKRDPRKLAFVAAWQLVFHYLDIYFTMFGGLMPAGPQPHWTDLTALVGLGAAGLAFGAWQLRRAAPVPVGDPYLQDSLRYQPQ
ncbi:MAG: hypothetical protein HZB56_21945 [Deltaproteobacteria bacterium]|nr:hypothetical protein [Deltaproteobacteria bacterium]